MIIGKVIGKLSDNALTKTNRNQRIHVDYPNHTLVHPPSWYYPEAVAVIVYFSDRRDCEGGTAVVPRTGKDDKLYEFPLVHTPGMFFSYIPKSYALVQAWEKFHGSMTENTRKNI